MLDFRLGRCSAERPALATSITTRNLTSALSSSGISSELQDVQEHHDVQSVVFFNDCLQSAWELQGFVGQNCISNTKFCISKLVTQEIVGAHLAGGSCQTLPKELPLQSSIGYAPRHVSMFASGLDVLDHLDPRSGFSAPLYEAQANRFPVIGPYLQFAIQMFLRLFQLCVDNLSKPRSHRFESSCVFPRTDAESQPIPINHQDTSMISPVSISSH